MKMSQIQKAVIEDGAKLIRPRKEKRVWGKPIEYDVKDLFTGNKRHWVMLDLFTASALQAVYNALSDKNKEKWDWIPVTRLVDFAWGHVK